MACRGCWECLLKLLNFLLTVSGLAMVGYGIYLFVEWRRTISGGGNDEPTPPVSESPEILALGRPMLMLVTLSESVLDKLPRAWFIYLFVAAGAVLFFISCVGCIGATTRNGCCLSFYSFLLILLILAELGCAAFIFFDHDWKDLIPSDKTGDFDMIYDFLKKKWKIAKWVALGVVILQLFKSYQATKVRTLVAPPRPDVTTALQRRALVFLLALIVRAANRPAEYDSDDEYIVAPRTAIRQPLINRQDVPATGVPVTGTLDQRPSRNDAWSKRMREKYGLDTSEFTYNPSDPNRFQQAAAPSGEERSRCTIL